MIYDGTGATLTEVATGDFDHTISEVTRLAIIDYLLLSKQWSGALEEHKLLARIYDLQRMPSTDHRSEYNTAYLDISGTAQESDNLPERAAFSKRWLLANLRG